jgi:hypothetical protein
MRIKQEYQVREVAGENIVILQGRYGADLTRIVTFNDSALLMWNELFGRDFTAQDAAAVLLQNYEVEEATAQNDAQLWIDKLTECNLLE